jgi:hypothetical protein
VTVLLQMVPGVFSDDWPGWDEGWAIVTFPLGIPLVLCAALSLAGPSASLRASAVSATAGVWLWGAMIFVAWLLVG